MTECFPVAEMREVRFDRLHAELSFQNHRMPQVAASVAGVA